MKNKFSSISVIGLGHVGLITAVTLAHKGFRVYGIDTNENIINHLQQSKTVIYEPNLQKVTLIGNVRMYDQGDSLFCDKLILYDQEYKNFEVIIIHTYESKNSLIRKEIDF